MIHMKCQVLFSLKTNDNKFRMSSSTVLPSILRVKVFGVFFLFCFVFVQRPKRYKNSKTVVSYFLLLIF